MYSRNQPSIMFVSKAGANPSEAPSRSYTLGEAPGQTRKHQTKLERPGRDKHCTLTRTIVNYGNKRFYNTDQGILKGKVALYR
jgi:hypothetical protein